MTKHYFDTHGWLSQAPIEGRETDIAPPDTLAPDGMGWNFTGYEWMLAPLNPRDKPQLRPHIVITHIQPDDANAASTLLAPNWSEVTCREGTRLAVSAELRLGAAVLPLTAQFRLPLRATDGRERVLLATMTGGLISISATLRDSGIWRVDEAGINSAMPEGQGFEFSGLAIYVLQD